MIGILKRFQNIIIAAILIVGAFIGYTYFFAPSNGPVLTKQDASATPAVDQDLISLLLELKSIKLDENIFSDVAFKSLQDFSQELVPEPVGRTNPFAPLGARTSVTPAK